MAENQDNPSGHYVLKLYITGQTPRSRRAVENVRKVCDDRIPGDYALEVVDIYQQPELAAREQLLAAPTLVKHLPLPVRRLIGDMSDEARLLAVLGLATA